MKVKSYCVRGKYDDGTAFQQDLSATDEVSAKKEYESIKNKPNVRAAEFRAKLDSGEEIPVRNMKAITENLNTMNTPEVGQFYTNKAESIVFIKEVENNLVVFDEEGTEHVLTMKLFMEYTDQEGYEHMKVVKNAIKEAVKYFAEVEDVIDWIKNTPVQEAKLVGDYKRGDKVSYKVEVKFKGPDKRTGKIVAIKGNKILLDTGDEIDPNDITN